MGAKLFYQYYVEGENEKKFIDTLKVLPKQGLISGKVNVFNPKDQRVTDMMIVPLKAGTIVILVFDTDTKCTETLLANIDKLKMYKNIKDVWCILQCKNLEDELVRSTDISNILEFYNAQGLNAHKRKFNSDKNLMAKLQEHHFDITKLWIGSPESGYKSLRNDAAKVKKY